MSMGEVAERVDRERLAARVSEHLARLPADTRLIYLLSCLDGLTSERIGAFVGLQPGAVRGRLHRARRRLARALDADESRESDRQALRRLTPEVIAVDISLIAAGGCSFKAPFPDQIASSLYSYLYTGVPWKEAVRRVAVPERLAETYLRTWERHLVVGRDGQALRPLVPVELRSDRPGIAASQHALAARWTEAVAARKERLDSLAEAAAPDGWVATAREALCLFLPHWRLFHELRARGLALLPLERPEGAGYLFGRESGPAVVPPNESEADLDLSFGFSDWMTGDSEIRLAAIRWWHIKHQPEVGGLLGRPLRTLSSEVGNPLPRVLLTFRDDPPGRTEARARLAQVAQSYEYSPEDLLDRLVGWRVLSDEAPCRLLLPAFAGEVAQAAGALATEVATEVAGYADDSRETLEELIQSSSFADCNRADVYHLLSAGLSLVVLAHLVRAALVPAFPDACFAERGLFIYEGHLMHG